MPQVINIRKPPPNSNFIYVGRPTIYGNPFSHKENTRAKYRVGTIEEAVSRFEYYFLHPDQEWLRKRADAELLGKDLGCYGCKPRCHADVILAYVNRTSTFNWVVESILGGETQPEWYKSNA